MLDSFASALQIVNKESWMRAFSLIFELASNALEYTCSIRCRNLPCKCCWPWRARPW
jgi:hypothetical protein